MFQDTKSTYKNQLYFYTSWQMIWKRNKENNPTYNNINNNKIFRTKSNQGGERSVHWKLKDIDERNWGKYK